ncbi:alpha/beta fold hydrolase, partial [Fulvivirga lutimaris]|uniref:alpha/beta hydrolase family protein n=1 Tax=Fulvivirga lutimaris TaxID=1819566 RepID=UPI001C873D25
MANFSSVSTDYGDVDLIINTSNKAEYILLLAHGAGAGMTHPFMEQVAEAFSESIFTVVRFNFVYMQNGKKLPDSPQKAHHVIEKVIEYTRHHLPKLPIILSGKSYGGRMSSQYAALNNPDIFGLIFFGFPLHAMGKPSIDRADHLKEISKQMLFLQGSRDKLAERN